VKLGLGVNPVPSRDEILALIRDSGHEDFVSHQILERLPWIFANQHDYVNWKMTLAHELDVDPI
jgi:hypothetical protein